MASAFQSRNQLLQNRDIESGFDNDAPPVGKFHAQTAASRRRADQIDWQQLLACTHPSTPAMSGTIIIQRVKSDTARTAKCLAAQTALLKIPHQALCFRLAPTTSLRNPSYIAHDSTSTCIRACEKSGFARMDTLDLLLTSWLSHGKQITIFDLGGIPAEVVDLVVATVSRVIFEIGFWGRDLKGVGRQGPALMIFEEAHGYLPAGSQSNFIQGFARKAVQRIVKEGRKYGIGAMVVSQRPSELDETILSQCGSVFALRLSNPQDQARVASVLPDSMAGIMDILPSLRTGEAVIVGEILPIPSRVRFPRIEPRPKSDDPEVHKFWSGTPKSDAEFEAALQAWRTQDVGVAKSNKGGP